MDGVNHNYVVSSLADLAGKINNEARHLRTQSTLICSEIHAPIPDAWCCKVREQIIATASPLAADAFCVIEVADSSYERDAGEKLIGYARSRVVAIHHHRSPQSHR